MKLLGKLGGLLASILAVALFGAVQTSALELGEPKLILDRAIPMLGSPLALSTDAFGERPTIARTRAGSFLAIAGAKCKLEGTECEVFTNNTIRIVKVDKRGKRSRLFARGTLGKGLRIGSRRDLWEPMNLTIGSGDRVYVEAELRGVNGSTRGTAIVAFDQRTGNLIKSFGRHGIVRLGVGWGRKTILSKRRSPMQLLVRPDNSLVECGISYSGKAKTYVAYLMRIRRDGSRDTAFGDRGELILSATEASADTAYGGCEAVAVDQQGRLVVAGRHYGPRGYESTWVRRLHANGEADTTFGSDGAASVPAVRGAGQDPWVDDEDPVPVTPRQMRVNEDGSILIAGWRHFDDVSGRTDLPAAARLLANGDLDPSFGNAGVFESAAIRANEPSIEPDGGIVFAGYAKGTSSIRGALLRLDVTGRPDEGFARGGLATSKDRSTLSLRVMFGFSGSGERIAWGLRSVPPYGKYGFTGKEELFWLSLG